MQQELQQEIPTINGFALAKQEKKGDKSTLTPTPQALLAFAYGINLLKKKDLNTSSFFNHIDQNLLVTKNEDLDFTGIEKTIQNVPKWFPLLKDIQEKINDPCEKHRITRSIAELRDEWASLINKDALFFAQ